MGSNQVKTQTEVSLFTNTPHITSLHCLIKWVLRVDFKDSYLEKSHAYLIFGNFAHSKIFGLYIGEVEA